MATPINDQSSTRLESISNQVYTVFGWRLQIIELRVYPVVHIDLFKGRMEEQNAKISFQGKSY